ncbi:cell envelope integrity protein TolA [Deefgea rivuli]|uniref:cell envelope integrity protein TolA n=1 Tax=Deefgea rivuli TaxID=400948 RepID=UPI0004893C57|nr:cell envelope integrity protein TolA [Deefgea rivuli]
MNPNRSNYPDEQRGLAFVLAVGMHVLLAGFLLFSVQWKTKKPEPVVVELWGAPPPALVASEQIAIAKPVKVPETKPDPVPVKAPDIVTEKVKATPIPTAKATAKPTATPTAKPTSAPTPTAAPKATAQPKTVATPVPAKATLPPKKAEVKKPKSELQDALSFDNMLDAGSKSDKPNPNAKVGGKAGGTGDTVGATGNVGKGKGAGLGEAYAKGVGQDIKQKIVYTPSNQNPRVAYKIYLLPSGEIRDIELVKASGDPKWDEAVKRAIQLYAPFPKPPAGASFNDYRDIRWEFAPKE